MADEAMEAIPGLGERKYTLPHYLEFASALQERAIELGQGWTAELVGRALWAEAKASILDIKVKVQAKAKAPLPKAPEATTATPAHKRSARGTLKPNSKRHRQE